MTNDITPILKDFPFEPGQINARMVAGDDGQPKIQVRLDLGVIQMQLEGRPDGQRPYDHESLLEFFEAVAEGRAAISDTKDPETDGASDNVDSSDLAPGDGADGANDETHIEDPFGPEPSNKPVTPFLLDSDQARALREEAAQFYQRYLALLVLEDFPRVVRDTTRNLRVIDFCKQHGQSEEDKSVLEQFRPYITMMRARALAGQALKDAEPKAAVIAIDEAIGAIQAFFADAGRPQLFESSSEVQMLRGMRDSLVPKLPVSLKSELKDRLNRALAQENYELAAILRDELKQMKE